MQAHNIGIIGFGNMGSAIGNKLKTDPASFRVWVYDVALEKLSGCEDLYIASNTLDLVRQSDTVILAVKPQDFPTLLDNVRNEASRKLFVTIAAGVATDFLEHKLGKVRVIRVMPNMAALIGRAMSCICKGSCATEQDYQLTESIFRRLGQTILLSESMMDPATAISGSGPGFLFQMIKNAGIDRNDRNALEDFSKKKFFPDLFSAALTIGFNIEESKMLCVFTQDGAISLLHEYRNLSLDELISRIASKGGTTEAGLEALAKGGNIQQAVQAALERARQLSRRN